MDEPLAFPLCTVKTAIVRQCTFLVIVAVCKYELDDCLSQLLLCILVEQSSLATTAAALGNPRAVIYGYSARIGSGGADSAICHVQRHGRRWDANGGGIAAHPHVPWSCNLLGWWCGSTGHIPIRRTSLAGRRRSWRGSGIWPTAPTAAT